MKHRKNILLLFIIVFTFIGCNKDSEPTKSNIQVRITDSPAKYDAVNIDIVSVSINTTNSETSGWQNLDLLRPGVYNLLDFQNGIDTLLVNQDIPSGKISQIRFVLGENNSIVKNNITYNLEVPSGLKSGIKLQLHAELVADIAYKLWIDFDASRSVVETGSNNFVLKPVIRAFTKATTGVIEGIVLPLDANTTVKAILNADTLYAFPNSDGKYHFPGLTPSTAWKLVFSPANSLYTDSIKENILVEQGKVTTITTVQLKNIN